MRRRFPLLLTFALLPLVAVGQATPPRAPADPAALAAVAKAWSLPAPSPDVPPYWAGARPQDLAAAALLWRSGGPQPAEGWKLRESEKTWEAAARKAGVAVDDVLGDYRTRVGEKERQALASEGGEWQVLAELRTLERLTGRNLRPLAAELASKGFEALLLENAPRGGVAEATPRPAPARDGPPDAPGDEGMNPLQPVLGQTPPNTGSVGATSTHQSRGR